MNYPFQHIKGEDIDLNRQDHRDEIIKRNKILESAILNGMDEMKVDTMVKVVTKLTCLKCGTNIIAKSKKPIESVSTIKGLSSLRPKVKCFRCKTSYKYNETEKTYFPKLKSTNKTTLL